MDACFAWHAVSRRSCTVLARLNREDAHVAVIGGMSCDCNPDGVEGTVNAWLKNALVKGFWRSTPDAPVTVIDATGGDRRGCVLFADEASTILSADGETATWGGGLFGVPLVAGIVAAAADHEGTVTPRMVEVCGQWLRKYRGAAWGMKKFLATAPASLPASAEMWPVVYGEFCDRHVDYSMLHSGGGSNDLAAQCGLYGLDMPGAVSPASGRWCPVCSTVVECLSKTALILLFASSAPMSAALQARKHVAARIPDGAWRPSIDGSLGGLEAAVIAGAGKIYDWTSVSYRSAIPDPEGGLRRVDVYDAMTQCDGEFPLPVAEFFEYWRGKDTANRDKFRDLVNCAPGGPDPGVVVHRDSDPGGGLVLRYEFTTTGLSADLCRRTSKPAVVDATDVTVFEWGLLEAGMTTAADTFGMTSAAEYYRDMTAEYGRRVSGVPTDTSVWKETDRAEWSWAAQLQGALEGGLAAAGARRDSGAVKCPNKQLSLTLLGELMVYTFIRRLHGAGARVIHADHHRVVADGISADIAGHVCDSMRRDFGVAPKPRPVPRVVIRGGDYMEACGDRVTRAEGALVDSVSLAPTWSSIGRARRIPVGVAYVAARYMLDTPGWLDGPVDDRKLHGMVEALAGDMGVSASIWCHIYEPGATGRLVAAGKPAWGAQRIILTRPQYGEHVQAQYRAPADGTVIDAVREAQGTGMGLSEVAAFRGFEWATWVGDADADRVEWLRPAANSFYRRWEPAAALSAPWREGWSAGLQSGGKFKVLTVWEDVPAAPLPSTCGRILPDSGGVQSIPRDAIDVAAYARWAGWVIDDFKR